MSYCRQDSSAYLLTHGIQVYCRFIHTRIELIGSRTQRYMRSSTYYIHGHILYGCASLKKKLQSLKVPERYEKCLSITSSTKGKSLPRHPSGREWATSQTGLKVKKIKYVTYSFQGSHTGQLDFCN